MPLSDRERDEIAAQLARATLRIHTEHACQDGTMVCKWDFRPWPCPDAAGAQQVLGTGSDADRARGTAPDVE